MDLGYVVSVAAGRQVVPRQRAAQIAVTPPEPWWQGRHETAIQLPGLGNSRHQRSGAGRRRGRHREPDEALHVVRELAAGLAALRFARAECPYERLARRCQ